MDEMRTADPRGVFVCTNPKALDAANKLITNALIWHAATFLRDGAKREGKAEQQLRKACLGYLKIMRAQQ